MNISRLAHQLKLTPKELLEILPKVGFDIGGRAQKVPDSQVDKIVTAVRRHQKLEALKSREGQVKEVREKKASSEKSREISLPETVIVKDLADMLNMPVARVMAEMMKNGIMATLNERLDFDTASIISEDLGYRVSKKEGDDGETVEQSKREQLASLLQERGKIIDRPPVVVVMGHVDHGKTKLLDAIRSTNIVEGESGGITQHIGAYQAEAKSKDGSERTVTFLDTPGHEAFKAMRSRGGQIADVAILVVAADDGLQPQTLESLAIIQKENLPFVVAINKVDKEEADIEKVKKELSEVNLIPEDWGGKTICVPISALQKQGIPELLEMVLLVADLEDLKADPEGDAVGTIIESHVDKGEGPVATVLVQAGTLKVNDLVIVGPSYGKLKAMKDWRGNELTEATPGTPVKILGIKNLPAVGEILQVYPDRKEYNKRVKEIDKFSSVRRTSGKTVQSDDTADEAIPSINLVVKADVLGSLEAVEESISKLASKDAIVRVIKKGLGYITEADILTAQATNATVVSFHLKDNKSIEALASEREVEILKYDVIYHLIEELEKRLKAIIKTEVVRELIGKLEILAIFKTKGNTVICGGKVTEGVVRKDTKIKILRGEEIVGYGTLTNLQSGKENVAEVAAPSEAGLEVDVEGTLEQGDVLEFFTEK